MLKPGLDRLKLETVDYRKKRVANSQRSGCLYVPVMISLKRNVEGLDDSEDLLVIQVRPPFEDPIARSYKYYL
jgi:hypothetical protein